jgi:hypothetical protein
MRLLQFELLTTGKSNFDHPKTVVQQLQPPLWVFDVSINVVFSG